MSELFIEALLDGAKDALWSLPILFIAYLLMEMLEESNKLNEGILNKYSHKAGPLLGGILGVIPQCGISGAAATLYATGSISVGTMLAVFFATSDEMLPILLSSMTDGAIGAGSIGKILLAKAAIGILLGYIADILLGRYFLTKKDIHSFCEREHCECEEDEEHHHIAVAALKHTLKIVVLLFAVNVVLNIIIGAIGVDTLSGSMLSKPVIGEIIAAVFGLIPNCSISIVLTRSYLSGMIGIGSMFAGLLSNAGIGLLVLFRTNRDMRENVEVLVVMLIFSIIAGVAISTIM